MWSNSHFALNCHCNNRTSKIVFQSSTFLLKQTTVLISTSCISSSVCFDLKRKRLIQNLTNKQTQIQIDFFSAKHLKVISAFSRISVIKLFLTTKIYVFFLRCDQTFSSYIIIYTKFQVWRNTMTNSHNRATQKEGRNSER